MTRRRLFLAAFAFGCVLSGVALAVTPPPGFIAVPESITVPEGGAGVVTIYEEGMS